MVELYLDWNWFFSSLAQSVAALVGIFAAFIITKVINNQGEFVRKQLRLRELLSISIKYREAASSRFFNWYATNMVKRSLKDLKESLEDEEGTRTPEEYYLEFDFSMYTPRSEVIEQIDRLIRSHSPKSPSGGGGISSYLPSLEIVKAQAESRRRLGDKVDEEGKEIQTLLLEIRQHIRLVRLHLDEIQQNPESSKLVNISIILAVVLFFVGVIYPLSFLPTDPTKQIQLSLTAFFTTLFSLKGFMLASASLIFLAITGTFWYVNSSLKYVPDEIERMRNATLVGEYSRYFEIREANFKALKEWREEHDQPEKQAKE